MSQISNAVCPPPSALGAPTHNPSRPPTYFASLLSSINNHIVQMYRDYPVPVTLALIFILTYQILKMRARVHMKALIHKNRKQEQEINTLTSTSQKQKQEINTLTSTSQKQKQEIETLTSTNQSQKRTITDLKQEESHHKNDINRLKQGNQTYLKTIENLHQLNLEQSQKLHTLNRTIEKQAHTIQSHAYEKKTLQERQQRQKREQERKLLMSDYPLRSTAPPQPTAYSPQLEIKERSTECHLVPEPPITPQINTTSIQLNDGDLQLKANHFEQQYKKLQQTHQQIIQQNSDLLIRVKRYEQSYQQLQDEYRKLQNNQLASFVHQLDTTI